MKQFENYYCYGEKMIFTKGSVILTPDDEQHAYLLHSGVCALSSRKKNQELKSHLYFMDQRIIGFANLTRNLLYPHETLPKNTLVLVAKTDCIVYRIDSEKIKTLMKTDLVFTNLLFETLSQNYLNIFHRFLQMEEESVPVRVCMFLLDYAYEEQGVTLLPRFFTFSEISEYLNIHLVTLSRVMRSLKNLGCVKKEDHHLVILRADMLKQIVEKEIELYY